MDGYIKLHRKILENPVVCKDAEYFAVWGYLLLNATHKAIPMIFKGEKIMLQPGQLITGRLSIANHFHLNESKVQRILKKLEIEQQIEQQTSNGNRLITVLNWSEYQGSEQQDEQPVNNERTTSEQRVNTNKNDKNDKNDKNVKNDKNIFNTIVETFNEICVSYPKVTKLSSSRERSLKARLKDYTIEDFKKLFSMAEESKFLKGEIETKDREEPWKANFDWLIKDSNMAKVLDGNYKDKQQVPKKPQQPKSTNKFNQFPQRGYTPEDHDKIEKLLLTRGFNEELEDEE